VFANVGGVLANILPEVAFGDMETVFVRISREFLVAILAQFPFIFFFPDITKTAEE